MAALVTLTLSSGSAAPGTTLSLDVSIASTGGAAPSAVQWIMSFPLGSISGITAATVGAAATAASKTLTQLGNNFEIQGPNTNVIGDGVIATFTFQLTLNNNPIPNPIPIQVIIVQVSDINGNLIASTGVTGYVTALIVTPPVPPVFLTSSPLPGGTDGVAYSFQFLCSGSLPITFTATGLPGWASLSSSGLLTGVPTAGTTSISVTASNVAGSVTNVFSLLIVSTGVAPTITSTSPITGAFVGVGYNFQFAASGTDPVIWTATGLPSWASLSAGGLLAGNPNATGVFTLQVTAANGTGSDGPHPFVLTVLQPLPLPCQALSTATIGAPYFSALSGVGGTAPYAFMIASGMLPPGITLGASSGQLNGIPTALGIFSFVIEIMDANGVIYLTSGCSITVSEVVPINASPCDNPVTDATMDCYLELTKVLVAFKPNKRLPVRGRS